MKKLFKIGCLGIIGLIVLIVIIGVATNSGSKSTSQSTSSTTKSANTKTADSSTKQADTNKQATQSASSKTPAANNGVLTKPKYDQIQNGMTYDQVTQIIGSKGELLSEAGDKNSPYYTAMYQFQTDGFMSNAAMTFQGGKLVSKAQMGLGGDSKVTINKTKYDQIQNGQTYEQVQQIVGGPGEVMSETGNKGTEFYTIMVDYPGEGGLGSNATLIFQGDKLQSKSQLGLE